MQGIRKSSLVFTISFIISLLFVTACADSSENVALPTSDISIEETPDQTVQTQNYMISIFDRSQGRLFTASKLDGSAVVSMISEDDLMSDYPAVFDELAMQSVTNGPTENNYYDSPNRKVKSDL